MTNVHLNGSNFNGIQLGDKVRCRVTAFEGVAVSVTKHLNGCVQFSLEGQYDPNKGEIQAFRLDWQQLEVVDKSFIVNDTEQAKEAKATAVGGPRKVETRAAEYKR